MSDYDTQGAVLPPQIILQCAERDMALKLVKRGPKPYTFLPAHIQTANNARELLLLAAAEYRSGMASARTPTASALYQNPEQIIKALDLWIAKGEAAE